MPPIPFKLLGSDGHTRRVTFENLPTWPELASKLNTLYGIPVDKVGVSYVDSDNDEITASSNQELQDFYQTSFQPGQLIRFKVLDLSISRDSAHSESSPPISTSNRNTFGEDPDNLDFTDWQRFNVADYFDDVPHAFVELVSSNGGLDKADTDSNSEVEKSTVQPAFVDKGKQKATSLGAASTASVLEADSAQKYPIHVMNIAQSRSAPIVDPEGEAAVHSTSSVPPTSSLNAEENNTSHDDPPLPTIESQSNVSASLTNDVATLLSSLSNVISSHPELSEGIRNIVHSAVSGTYWEAHRAALSRAANDMQQATGQFEQEAAQRVSEALGNLFRSFSQVTDDANGTQNPPQQPMRAPESQRPFPWYQPPFSGRRYPWGRRYTTGFDPQRFPPWDITPWSERGQRAVHGSPPRPPPPPPPPPPFGPFYGPRNPIHNNNPFYSFPPPPPPCFRYPDIPPLPRETIPRPLSPPPGLFSKDPIPNPATTDGPTSEERIPPLTPPVVEHLDSRESAAPLARGHYRGRLDRHHYGSHGHGRLGHRPSSAGEAGDIFNIAPSVIPPSHSNSFLPPHKSDSSSSNPTSQQLRAQVEEAKRIYKEQKEIYRREREDRKNQKGGHKHDDANFLSTNIIAGEGSHVVSKAWGSYPQLEMYSSGPRRHNTHLGHGSTSRDDLTSRALSRITRRLSDVSVFFRSKRNVHRILL